MGERVTATGAPAPDHRELPAQAERSDSIAYVAGMLGLQTVPATASELLDIVAEKYEAGTFPETLQHLTLADIERIIRSEFPQLTPEDESWNISQERAGEIFDEERHHPFPETPQAPSAPRENRVSLRDDEGYYREIF